AVYFYKTVDDSNELWRTDGTPQGTRLVRDTAPFLPIPINVMVLNDEGDGLVTKNDPAAPATLMSQFDTTALGLALHNPRPPARARRRRPQRTRPPRPPGRPRPPRFRSRLAERRRRRRRAHRERRPRQPQRRQRQRLLHRRRDRGARQGRRRNPHQPPRLS